MLRSRRESPHNDGITEPDNLQQTFATKSAISDRNAVQQTSAYPSSDRPLSICLTGANNSFGNFCVAASRTIDFRLEG